MAKTPTARTKVAIIGSGNIGTDLMIKIMRLSSVLEMGVMVGIDPASDGLARAAGMGVATTADGIDGLLADARIRRCGHRVRCDQRGRAPAQQRTGAGSRQADDRPHPAAIGPYTIPPVDGEANLDALNVNMVTCGGQATIPIVAAVNRVAEVRYGEIIASIASKSAGPGTRANIDEFTETTSQASRRCGRGDARQGDRRAQPGRTPADHARYGLLPVRGRRPRARSASRSTIWSPKCRVMCPVTGSSRRYSSKASAAISRCAFPRWP